MRTIADRLVRLLKREDGPTAVEYAVLLALIVVVCLAAVATIGSQTNSAFSTTGAKIAAAAS